MQLTGRILYPTATSTSSSLDRAAASEQFQPRSSQRSHCWSHENSELSAAPNPAQQASPSSRIEQHGVGPSFRSAASICPGTGRALLALKPPATR